MLTLLRTRITLVWLLLTAATVLSWAMGHGFGFSDHHYAAVAILVVAFVKARFVMLDFMELRQAPRFLRRLAEVWLVAVCAILVVVYWYGPSSPYLAIAQEVIDGLR